MNKLFVFYGIGLTLFLMALNSSKSRLFDMSGFGSGSGGYYDGGSYRSYGGGGYHK